jgi:hypothetical protein
MTAAARIAPFEPQLHESLSSFFESDYAELQGASVVGLPEHGPLRLDFDGTLSDAWETTLETMEEQGLDADPRETVDFEGSEYTPIAFLFNHAQDSEPVDAYLAADLASAEAPVLFVDPSGEPTLLADGLAAFTEALKG